ncbi:MAG: hypothetical protein J6Y02_02290 [Pseudobutyrivibrio sp.]|nr:hypothetical protein [Pseudobutyrivibrio sp.]
MDELNNNVATSEVTTDEIREIAPAPVMESVPVQQVEKVEEQTGLSRGQKAAGIVVIGGFIGFVIIAVRWVAGKIKDGIKKFKANKADEEDAAPKKKQKKIKKVEAVDDDEDYDEFELVEVTDEEK